MFGHLDPQGLLTASYMALSKPDVLQTSERVEASRGSNDHVDIQIIHSGSKCQPREGRFQKTWVCGILVFMWSFGQLARACRIYLDAAGWSSS